MESVMPPEVSELQPNCYYSAGLFDPLNSWERCLSFVGYLIYVAPNKWRNLSAGERKRHIGKDNLLTSPETL